MPGKIIQILLFFLIIFCSASVNAQLDSALIIKLEKLVISDQKIASLPPPGIEIGSAKWKKFTDSILNSGYEEAKNIFNLKGFPGYTLVGKEGSKNFWLLVQHCDKWPEFQIQVLKAMKKEMRSGNASPQDFAYLTDRVNLNTNKEQIYGTQVNYNTDSCQAFPKNLKNPAKVNRRRKSVGLEPLENYLNEMSISHFEMNNKIYEKKGINRPKLYRSFPEL